jgi:predicted DCC family thiol-disulfide oxidoreductase YuxK
VRPASTSSGLTRLQYAGLSAFVILLVVVAKPLLHLVLPHVFPLAQQWHIDVYGRRVDGHTLTSAALIGLMGLAGFSLLGLIMTSRTFAGRYVSEATPESLAAIRILACVILLGSVLREDLASTALIPSELRQPMGVMGILYALPIGFRQFAASGAHLSAFKWLTALLLLLGCIGWGTRIVVPLAAVGYLVFAGILREYSYYYHQHLVPLYLLIVLSWTPCGDGWSIDRLWRELRGRPVPAARRSAPAYGWSQYACWVVIAFPYVEAGFSKLRNGGWFWWDPVHIRAILYRDTLYLAWPGRLNWDGFSLHLTGAPDLLFALLGLSALVIEISYGLVLFSKSARRILPIAAFLMHLGMFLLQKVLFLDLLLVQFIFFDVTRIRNAIMRRLGTSGKIQVLYDGWCPRCRRTIRVLTACDVSGRLEPLDSRHLDLGAYNRAHGLDLSQRDIEERMYVISRGKRVESGFAGFCALARALPAFWPFLPVLMVPGVSVLGALAYRYVARNRFVDRKCGPGCGIPSTREPRTIQEPAAPRRVWPQAISGVIAVLLVVWVYRIESYPLSAWQMYSGYWKEVVYTKVYVHLESGAVSPAYFEDAIGALAANRAQTYLEMCFSPADARMCETFLGAVAAAYNSRAPHRGMVTQLEIQEWSWDFRVYPSEPQRATPVRRYLFELPHASAARQ